MTPLRTAAGLLIGLALSLLAGCSSTPDMPDGDRALGPEPTPRYEPPSKYGNPASYVVHGKRYYVRQNNAGYRERGTASWYGPQFHGKRTSSGETFDMYAMTAAHRSLVLPAYARVTNLENGRSVVVRVNDRGPFHGNRLIDLSYAAAERLGMADQGTARVEVEVVQPGGRQAANRPVSAGAEPQWGRNVYIQVGAFGDLGNARRLRDRLQARLGAPVGVQTVERGGRVLHRVRVGPVASSAQADRLLESLFSQGLSGQHVVIDDCSAGGC